MGVADFINSEVFKKIFIDYIRSEKIKMIEHIVGDVDEEKNIKKYTEHDLYRALIKEMEGMENKILDLLNEMITKEMNSGRGKGAKIALDDVRNRLAVFKDT